MSLIHDLRSIQSQGTHSLRTVEISVTDVCNRSCEFCPQSSGFKTTRKFIAMSTIATIADQLADINYTGRISFAGFGEPLVFPLLVEAIELIASKVVNVKWIEVITNADFLTNDMIKELESAGCTNITISMYDHDISDKFESSVIDLTYKKQYEPFDKVDRINIVEHSKEYNIDKPCFIPYYKMLIDSTGDVLLCAHDWTKTVMGNIKDHNLIDIWQSEVYVNFRQQTRSSVHPCNSCNVGGTLYGESAYENI